MTGKEGPAKLTNTVEVKWPVVEKLLTAEEAEMSDRLPRASKAVARALKNREGRYARFDN